MTTTAKTTRNQLATVVDLLVAPARIRRFLDKRGLNREAENDIADAKEQLHAIMKEGAPPCPESAPASPDGDASDADRSQYESALATYNKQRDAYDAWRSPRYETLERVHALGKDLMKLQALHNKRAEASQEGSKKRFTEKNEAAMQKIVARINDSEQGYSQFVGKTDLSNPSSVDSLLQTLRSDKYEDVNIFFRRDESSNNKLRFNTRAEVAIAAVVQRACEEFAGHAMDHVMHPDVQKKIIKPDHCISDGIEDCSLYSLYSPLPTFQAVRQRKLRQQAHEASNKEIRNEALRKARVDAKKRGRDYKAPKVTLVKFEDQEVEDGYAERRVTTTTNKEGEEKTRTKYLWYGIDVPHPDGEDTEDVNFEHYTKNVCKQVAEDKVDIEGRKNYADVKIGQDVTKFLSDLIQDFIHRLQPLILILLKHGNTEIKTISDSVIMRAIQLLLVDSPNYVNRTGNVELNEDHKALFRFVEEKLALLESHEQSKKNKKTSSDTTSEEDDEEVVEKTETPKVEKPKKTEKSTKARRRRTRK